MLAADGTPTPGVDQFVNELRACDRTPPTAKSYCFDLLRWFRFLAAVDVTWDKATRTEVRDYVLWIRTKPNPQRRRSSAADGRPPAGSLNARTGKRYLKPGYAANTINHSLTVISGFYETAIFDSLGPLVNPVPASGRGGHRRGQQNRPVRRGRLRQATPVYQPRSISEDLLQELFAALSHERDRALIAVTLSSGLRASELLSMRVGGVDAGRSAIEITPKGRPLERVWVPTATESVTWIGRALDGRPVASPDDPLWLTLRKPLRPIGYPGLRGVLERANATLGTNLTWHDLRHTFSAHLLDDKALSLVEVQHLMRHQSLSSLAPYAATRLEDMVTALHAHLTRPAPPPPSGPSLYAPEDMNILFPGSEP